MTPSFAISSALRDPDQLGSPVYEELVGEEIYWTIDIPSKGKRVLLYLHNYLKSMAMYSVNLKVAELPTFGKELLTLLCLFPLWLCLFVI